MNMVLINPIIKICVSPMLNTVDFTFTAIAVASDLVEQRCYNPHHVSPIVCPWGQSPSNSHPGHLHVALAATSII